MRSNRGKGTWMEKDKETGNSGVCSDCSTKTRMIRSFLNHFTRFASVKYRRPTRGELPPYVYACASNLDRRRSHELCCLPERTRTLLLLLFHRSRWNYALTTKYSSFVFFSFFLNCRLSFLIKIRSNFFVNRSVVKNGECWEIGEIFDKNLYLFFYFYTILDSLSFLSFKNRGIFVSF